MKIVTTNIQEIRSGDYLEICCAMRKVLRVRACTYGGVPAIEFLVAPIKGVWNEKHLPHPQYLRCFMSAQLKVWKPTEV
jgi:hypothetical protein